MRKSGAVGPRGTGQGRREGAVQAIIFDFGNVISAFDTGIFLRRLLERSEGTFEELSAAIYESGVHRTYEAGRITSDEFFATVRDRCGLRMGEQEFFEAFTDIFTPIPATSDLIRRLSGRYRIGLLSNTNERHFENTIRRADVFPLFETVTVSHVVHALKPGEAIYRDALAKLGLPPGECAYIDDIPEYVDGARTLGIRGVHYTGHDRLTSSLRDLGIVF